MPQTAVARAPACTVRTLAGEAAEAERWQAYVASHAGATIYHDLAWREIFGRGFGYRSHYLAAEGADGALRGVLPLFQAPSMLGKPRLVSVPFRDRGGVLFDDSQAFQALLNEAETLRARLRATHVALKTIAPYPEASSDGPALKRVDYWVHSQTDLGAMEPEKLLRKVGDKTRNMLRQAEQAGLRVEEIADPAPALASWLSVYRRSQHGLGLPAFPSRFFERMLSLLMPRGLAKLFAVRGAGGELAAAMIVLLEPSRAIYAYSASTQAGREARANDLMLFHLLNWSIERGLKWLDFGSDSPLQEGLLFFKRKWFAKQSPIPTYYLGEPPAAPVDSSVKRFDTARAIVRRMPRQFSQLCLTPMTRYLG